MNNHQSGDIKKTISGNRGLKIEEPLIFEHDNPGMSGVDIPDVKIETNRLGGLASDQKIGLPGLSESQIVRHYTRLSQKNYAIDAGIFPLGSCTMKHNPRLNEKMARLPGLVDLHPLQPISTIQGALAIIRRLSDWLQQLTGMAAVAMSPAAGAHGELCGMMAIQAALRDRNEKRNRVLVP
ncbi:MAG TPA: aminomethyl-transferring glycine dehydrogenase subunit GcvPB, partial [Alphaproteobacteria bacterium]|nr:aminomethyl-transferring glycine dehydrogenase subunit GcvPB [Alphaproteobacteria bacterium]